MRALTKPFPPDHAKLAALRESALARTREVFNEILQHVRADLDRIAQAVAADFGLPGDEAGALLKPQGLHRHMEAKAVVTVLALALLPVTQLTLATLYEGSEKTVYRWKVSIRIRTKNDPDFAARLQRLRAALDQELTGPRRMTKEGRKKKA